MGIATIDYGSFGPVPDIMSLRDAVLEYAIANKNEWNEIPQNVLEAYSYLMKFESSDKQARNKYSEAAFCLEMAKFYRDQCEPRNESRAFDWYLCAAERESLEAQLEIAVKLSESTDNHDKQCAIRLFEEITRDESVYRHADELAIYREALMKKLIFLSKTDPTLALPELKKGLANPSITEANSKNAGIIINAIQDAYSRAGTHTTVIMKYIEPAQGKDVKDSIKRYQSLLAPIPLAKNDNLASVARLLDSEFPWMNKVTKHIIRQIKAYVMMGVPVIKIPPLLLVGSPGIGKTRYLARLSTLLGIPHLCYPVGGHSDNRDFAGTSRGWTSGHACLPLKLIAQEMIANPLIILDEIDKANHNDDMAKNGKITDTLHLMLESVTAVRFYDDFLCGEADLSWVNWVATANDISRLPQSLLGRFQVVKVMPPGMDDYPAIVHGIMRDIADKYHTTTAALPCLSEAEWYWLERYYGNIRRLRKAVETLISYMLDNNEGRIIH